jgi:hypothetical protein
VVRSKKDGPDGKWRWHLTLNRPRAIFRPAKAISRFAYGNLDHVDHLGPPQGFRILNILGRNAR